MRLPPRAWQLALQLTALLCATLLLPQVGLIRALEQLSVDWRFITRGVRAPTERIVIVEIDQDSLDALPEPTIFWGKYHGQVISALHDLGARAIGFDVLQPNPLSEYLGDGEDPDSAWAEALFGAPETVLIYQLSHLPDGTTAQIVPAPQLNYALALAGGQLGFSTTEPDDDQVIRRQPLADSTEGDEEHVAFPLSVASVVTGEEVSIGEDSVSLGKFVLPTDEQRRLPINFRGAARTFPHVSYLEVLRSPEKHREQLKDAFVLVGNTVLAFHDFHTVPYSRL